jgi:hypothetical protein
MRLTIWEQDVGGSRLHLSEAKKSLFPDQSIPFIINYSGNLSGTCLERPVFVGDVEHLAGVAQPRD